MKNQFN